MLDSLLVVFPKPGISGSSPNMRLKVSSTSGGGSKKYFLSMYLFLLVKFSKGVALFLLFTYLKCMVKFRFFW